MNKLYDRIDFVNNTTPALNETNLDLMSKAIDDIDDRVIEIAGDVLVVVPEILDKYADIEALATNPPYVGQNGHWWTWDTDLNQYVDSGVDAGVSVNVGTTTTLPAGSDATVTNSGTDTDPILNFGIPQGVAGQNGQDGQDGTDGVSPEVTITQITDGHTVTITDADHPTGQSFNVMDGQDGSAGVGVPSGGTTGQVLKKASGTDYDTEWANESGGGSDGHTIINSAGTSMTQRAGLQFEGMGVTDDSTNDRTKVKLPIFNGTTAEWEALSSTEKAKYTIVNFSNDYGNDWTLLHSNTVTTGNTIQTNIINTLNIDISPYKEIAIMVGISKNDTMYYFLGSEILSTSLLGVVSDEPTVWRCDPKSDFGGYIQVSHAKKITLSSISAYYGGSAFTADLRVYGIK